MSPDARTYTRQSPAPPSGGNSTCLGRGLHPGTKALCLQDHLGPNTQDHPGSQYIQPQPGSTAPTLHEIPPKQSGTPHSTHPIPHDRSTDIPQHQPQPLSRLKAINRNHLRTSPHIHNILRPCFQDTKGSIIRGTLRRMVSIMADEHIAGGQQVLWNATLNGWPKTNSVKEHCRSSFSVDCRPNKTHDRQSPQTLSVSVAWSAAFRKQ